MQILKINPKITEIIKELYGNNITYAKLENKICKPHHNNEIKTGV